MAAYDTLAPPPGATDAAEPDYEFDDELFGISDQPPNYTPDIIRRMTKEWDADFDMSGNGGAKWRREAKVAYAVVAGDPWEDDNKADLIDALRVPVVFNRAEPMVNAVTGAQIANRQSMAFFPREAGDSQADEVISAAMDYERDACMAQDEESDAARDALISGLGWMEQRLDREDDPKGSIIWEQVDPFEMAADSGAKKKGLSDARRVRRIREMGKEEFGEFRKAIGDLGRSDGEPTGAPGDFPQYDDTIDVTNPHDAYREGDDYEDRDSPRKTYEVREYQWWVRHIAEDSDWRVSDPQTGRSVVLSVQQYRQLAMQFAMQGMALQGRPLPKKCIYRVFTCRGKILGVGAHRLPGITSMTYKVITGQRDKAAKTWYGIIRALIDPQRFVNSLFSQILHIIDSSAKGGVWYEEDALDIEELEAKFAEVDANIPVHPGTLSGPSPKIKSRAEMAFPVGYDKLLQFVWQSFPWVSGINPNLFGMATEKGESGILDAQRTRQAYGVLQWFFASVRRYSMDSGKLALELLAHVDPGKLVRVVAGNQRQYVPLIFDGDVSRYDIVIDEAADSPSAKDRNFEIFMALAPMFKSLGVTLPPEALMEMLRSSPLPSSTVEAMVTAMQKPNPQQQMAEAGAQAEIAKTQADAQLAQAKAQSEALAPQLAQAEMALKQGEQQLQRLEIEARLRELEVKVSGDQQKAQADFEKAQLALLAQREDVEAKRIALEQNIEAKRIGLEQARVKLDQTVAQANAPPTKVAVSADNSGMEGLLKGLVKQLADGQEQTARAGAEQAKAFTDAMKALAEEFGGERELVRDESGRAVGVRRKRAAA